MTDLSPSAKAVLGAAHDGANAVLFDIGDDSPVPICAAAAAAALRAAASKLREAYANEEYVDSPDDWLDSIAAELEALPE